MICLYSGAENNSGREKCFSCAAALPKRFDLTKEDYEKLSIFIHNIEKHLNRAGDKTGYSGFIFIILIFSGILYLIYSLYHILEYKILFLILSALFLFVFFNMIGAVLTSIFKNAVYKIFTKKIKQDILLYLKKHKIKKTEFKYAAASELKKKSLLIKHINKI